MAEVKSANQKKVKLIGRIMIYNLLFIIVLIIALIGLLSFEQTRKKFIFNGRDLGESKFAMLEKQNGFDYISLEDIIKLPQMKMYKINNGKYDGSNISEDYFYIDTKYEAVEIDKKENKFTKYIKYEYLDRELDENGELLKTEQEIKENKDIQPREKTSIDNAILNQENFTLKSGILVKDGKRYVTLEDAKYIFNINIVKNGEKRITFQTIPYLEKKVAAYLEDQRFSLSNNYQNRRAIIDGYIAVVDSSKKSGIQAPNEANTDYINRIPVQYDEVRYAQNSQNLYCVKDKNLGIINVKSKKNVVELSNYDTLEIYLEDKGIYKVGVQQKVGLIDSEGNKIVPIEYDQIGLNILDFPDEKDGKLLFERYIPVKKTTERKTVKWGLEPLDKKYPKIPVMLEALGYTKLKLVNPYGSENVEFTEDQLQELKARGIKDPKITMSKAEALELGYTTERAEIIEGVNLLTIPKSEGVEGIIYKTEEGKYGIINADDPTGEALVALSPQFDKMYKYTDNGQAKYIAYGANGKQEIKTLIEQFKKSLEISKPKSSVTQTPQVQQVGNGTQVNVQTSQTSEVIQNVPQVQAVPTLNTTTNVQPNNQPIAGFVTPVVVTPN